MQLHNCSPTQAHQGYAQSVTRCFEDQNGRFWLTNKDGRNMTQAQFCPFCGGQCLDDTEPKKPSQILKNDIALTPPDKPTRTWVQCSVRRMVRHRQFWVVKVLATDGQHMKVLLENGQQATVCVENVEPIVGEKLPPKMGQSKKDQREKQKPNPDTAREVLRSKYLNLGLQTRG